MGGNSCTFIIRVQLAVIISYSDLLIYGFLCPKHLFDWKKWMERRGQRNEKEREWERKWEKRGLILFLLFDLTWNYLFFVPSFLFPPFLLSPLFFFISEHLSNPILPASWIERVKYKRVDGEICATKSN